MAIGPYSVIGIKLQLIHFFTLSDFLFHYCAPIFIIYRVPLSVDILEFNDGTATSSSNFCDLIIGYQSSLLDLTATVIQLELVIKNGFKNFTDQVLFCLNHFFC